MANGTKRWGAESLKINYTIRLSVDEKLRLKRAAEKAHQSMADYVRVRLDLPTNRWWKIPKG